jgi:hypothetical protein
MIGSGHADLCPKPQSGGLNTAVICGYHHSGCRAFTGLLPDSLYHWQTSDISQRLARQSGRRETRWYNDDKLHNLIL